MPRPSLFARLSGALQGRMQSPYMRRAAGSFGLRFGGLFLQFAGSVAVARLLGVAAFGSYSYAYTWAVIGGGVLGLGLAPLAIRELPRYLARGQLGLLRGYLTAGLAMILAMTGIAAGLLAGLEAMDLLHFDMGWPLVLMVGLVQALILSLSALLNGFQRIVLSQFIENVLRYVLFLVALGVLFLLAYPFDAAAMLTVSLVMALPVVAVMVWAARRAMKAEIPGPLPAPDYALRLWLVAALPLLATNLMVQLQTNLDVLLIGAMASDADVGRYRAASRGADLMLIANTIATQVLGPMLARALAKPEGAAEGQRLISQSARVSALLGLPLGLGLGLGAAYYLRLFGPDFVAAAPALQILIAAQVVAVLCGPVSVVLVMLGRERQVLWVNLGALALNLVLNLTLIPRFGILGAATSTFVAVVVVRLTLLALVRRQSGFDPTLWPVARRWLGRRGRGSGGG